MIDYSAALAVAAIVRTGSFEKAARALSVTPSAISQRVRLLEERLGAVLIERGNPCVATEKGAWLCRHVELVGMLEATCSSACRASATPLSGPVTLDIAVNADSLGTWFMPAAAAFTRSSKALLKIAVDDQDHTADWLRRGHVVAAVTSLAKPVAAARSARSAVCATTPPPARIHRPSLSERRHRRRACPGPGAHLQQKDTLQQDWARRRWAQLTPVPPTGCRRRRASSRPPCSAWAGASTPRPSSPTISPRAASSSWCPAPRWT